MSIGFYLKKIVGTLLMPLPAITILLLVAFVLLWWTRWKTQGKVLVAVTLVLLYVLSLPFIPHAALTAVEGGASASDAELRRDSVEWVVVLSGNAPGGAGYSSVNRVGGPTLARLAEGIRVLRLLPEARLVVSGGDFEGGYPSAPVMRDVAVDLGVDPSRVIVEDESWDTDQSAANVASIVNGGKVALVTSASHMDRALAHFRDEGIEAVPVRSAYSYTQPVEISLFTFAPTPGNLSAVSMAWYEFLGSVWGRIMG